MPARVPTMERHKTTQRIRGTTLALDESAIALRQRTTPAEEMLWSALRGRMVCGLKFRRQHPIGPFVVDFWCPERNLVVEVDGDVHDGQAEQDAYRDEHLAAFGCRVLRFRNGEVLHDLVPVLKRIADAAAS